jgi:hypothetical protein
MTTISTSLPSTGFEQPSDKQLLALLKIVLGAREGLRDHAAQTPDFEMEFARAFVAVGYAFRLREPSTARYFHAFVEDANTLLRTYWTAKAVSGTALITAIIAHGDVPWRPANRAVGQLLEVGLDPYSGIRCSNAWREILKGRPLRDPLPPRKVFVEAVTPTPVTVFKQNRPGQPWVDATGSNDPLWR